MKIPSNKTWTQDNSGDTFGVLSETYNMALDTAGKARLARKVVNVYGTQDDADFGFPLSIDYVYGHYVILTDDEIFEGNAPSYNFADIAFSPTTFLGSDAVVFNDLYTFSTATSVYTWDGGSISGSWDDQGVTVTTGINHPLAVFGTECAVGNGNQVILFNTSYVTTQTLVLPTEFRVTTMRAVNDLLYIGTRNLNGGNAKIFIWDGNSSLFYYEVEVGAHWVFSMTAYLSTVAAITSQGQLGIVNGTNFQELAGLPVYFNPHAKWQGSGGLQLNGKVFNRGMATIGDTIYINIEGEVDSGFMPEMKSGIWVYDPAVGLYHRASATQDILVSDNGLSLSNSTLTTSAPHLLNTGDSVTFSGTSGLVGVDTGINYYVSVISDDEIKLAATRKALERGNFVTITGTPGASDVLVYAQNSEYGIYDITSGAIIPTMSEETTRSNMSSEILWGCRYRNTFGINDYGLFSFVDAYNIGNFITQRIYSDNVAQNWQNLYNFIDGLTVSSEEVVLKVQTKYEEDSKLLEGVWLSTNTINNIDSKDFSLFTDIEAGDEIVITDDYGRGRTAHVLNIERSSTIVSVTLDEDSGTANEDVTFYRTTFNKVGEAMGINQKEKEKLKSAVAEQIKASPWCRIKVELRGFAPAVNLIDLENVVNRKG